MTSTGRPVEVSFEVVAPPGLSRCVVHCPELTAGDLSAPPLVTGADGAFLLIRVIFPERGGRGNFVDVFLYKAGLGAPSLHLLPRPYPVHLHFNHVGVFSSGDGHCLVVVPERRFRDGGRRMSYDLQVFSTKTSSWITTATRVTSDLEGYYGGLVQHQPTKVFSVGGDSLARVDIYLGILLCDVLGKDPEMRLIELPPLTPTKKVKFGVGSDDATPSLRPIRDVTCRNGVIRFIETGFQLEFSDSRPTQFPWTATMSKRSTFCSDEWETCTTVDSASLSPADSCLADLFPEIWDCKENKLTLSKVISTAPTLDVYNDSVFYIKSKLNPRDPNGWVIAVDTRDKKLDRVVPFSAKRLYFDHNHLQCDFSRYLGKAARSTWPKGRSNAPAVELPPGETFELLETYLLAALGYPKNIELLMESLKQRHNGNMSLLWFSILS